MLITNMTILRPLEQTAELRYCQTKSECFWPWFLCGLVPLILFLFFFKYWVCCEKNPRNISTYLNFPSGVSFMRGQFYNKINAFSFSTILLCFDFIAYIYLYMYMYHNKFLFPSDNPVSSKKYKECIYQNSLYWNNV